MVLLGPLDFLITIMRASVGRWAFEAPRVSGNFGARVIAIWHEETLADLLRIVVVRVGTIEGEF